MIYKDINKNPAPNNSGILELVELLTKGVDVLEVEEVVLLLLFGLVAFVNCWVKVVVVFDTSLIIGFEILTIGFEILTIGFSNCCFCFIYFLFYSFSLNHFFKFIK